MLSSFNLYFVKLKKSRTRYQFLGVIVIIIKYVIRSMPELPKKSQKLEKKVFAPDFFLLQVITVDSMSNHYQ